jgi:hypothetical protein
MEGKGGKDKGTTNMSQYLTNPYSLSHHALHEC